MTPVERLRFLSDKQFIDSEEAKRIAEANAVGIAQGSANQDPDREAPPVGGDGSRGAAGNVGGYDSFRIDNGDAYAELNGKIRTSIDPMF